MLYSLFSKSRLSFGRTFLPKELANPQRILVTHFGSIAEIIRTVPVLVALRHRFPYSEIAWLIEANAAPILLDHWTVNRFIVVRSDWLKHLSEIRRVRRRLRAFAPQVAVDSQNSFDSSLAVWLANTKYRIGFGGKQSRLLHNVHVVSEEERQIEQNLQLLQPFGIFGSGIGFDMPECEKDRLAARNILHRNGIHENVRFALLHISADSPAARWQEERYGRVAKYLLDQWNLPSLIVWSGYEQELRRAESAVHAAHGAAFQAPWTTLAERRSLSNLATVFIGADTAELQLAAAVGTACVGLFGPTSALENAPFGQEHRMVQAEQQTKKRASVQRTMDAISPEMVFEKCDEVLTKISSQDAVPMLQTSPKQKKAA